MFWINTHFPSDWHFMIYFSMAVYWPGVNGIWIRSIFYFKAWRIISSLGSDPGVIKNIIGVRELLSIRGGFMSIIGVYMK